MQSKELVLERIFDNGDATIGSFKELNTTLHTLLGFTCEDQKQKGSKVMHETRIPAGRYRLVLNKVLTDLTKKYRKNYSWFTWHIMLENVPGFTGIYIHIGNHDDNTSGCLLLGDTVNNIFLKEYGKIMIQNSTNAYKRFYTKYVPLLEQNVPVYLTIVDEKY